LHHVIKDFGYFAFDYASQKVVSVQCGVMRVNCLDCLDRTNVMISKVALDSLVGQMAGLGVSLQELFREDPLDHMDNGNIEQNHPLMLKFKYTWADNGDAISMHYTGVGSTHTEVTKTGKKDFFTMIKHVGATLGRLQMQIFEDDIKQQAIDIVLGKSTQTVNVFEANVQSELQKRSAQFCEKSAVSLLVLSLNLEECPPGALSLESLFDEFQKEMLPELVVVGLQSLMSTQPSGVSKEAFSKECAQHLLAGLGRHGKYIPIQDSESQGCLLLLFAKV